MFIFYKNNDIERNRKVDTNMTIQINKAEIVKTLQLLTKNKPGAVVEIRLLPRKGKGIVAGYFDSYSFNSVPDKLNHYLNRGEYNCYVTMNALHDGLLSRYYRRFEQYPLTTTTDSEVLSYHWIMMDFDPVRPAGINATAEEQQSAVLLAAVVKEYCLKELDMDEPIECISGNGVHHLYPFDMPVNAESISIVKNLLIDLAKRFNNERCTVDTTNFNPSRITKLYGTVAGKGDNTPSRPHRLAEIKVVPTALEVNHE